MCHSTTTPPYSTHTNPRWFYWVAYQRFMRCIPFLPHLRLNRRKKLGGNRIVRPLLHGLMFACRNQIGIVGTTDVVRILIWWCQSWHCSVIVTWWHRLLPVTYHHSHIAITRMHRRPSVKLWSAPHRTRSRLLLLAAVSQRYRCELLTVIRLWFIVYGAMRTGYVTTESWDVWRLKS